MKRLKCTVSYVGRQYDGWQSQKSGNGIQDHLEAAISRIENRPVTITGSGRTDAGVSAQSQVFMFDTERTMSEYKWMGAINAFLPDDIHISAIEEVPDTFHARHSVRWKKYVYRVNDGPYDVFTKDIACQYGRELDIDQMRDCAEVFTGTHDFTSFNSSSLQEYPDQTRTVFSIEIHRNNGLIEMEFKGKGFLRYMVRMMAAALIDAGSGKLGREDIRKMLESRDKRCARRNAPACGLTLQEVNYFERIAVNREVQIREFIHSDVLPYESWQLLQIEENCRFHTGERAYMFCKGLSQQPLGYFLMNEKENVLVINDEDSYEMALSLSDQLSEYTGNRGFSIEKRQERDDSDILFSKDKNNR